MAQKIGAGLLLCTDKIWETADTLRGAGIKASERMARLHDAVLRPNDARIAAAALPAGTCQEFKNETENAFDFKSAAHLDWLEYFAKTANGNALVSGGRSLASKPTT